MLGVLDDSGRLRLAAPRYFGGETYEGWHALVPAMVGLLVPILLPVVLTPWIVGEGLVLLLALMFAMLVLAVAVAVYSVIAKGRVVSVTLRPATGMLEIVHKGPFANSMTLLPVEQLASLEMSVGQPSHRNIRAVSRLVTTDGRAMTLPDEIGRGELATFRAKVEDVRRRRQREVKPGSV
ncbi:MAG: hypothetical protein ACK4MF_07940 [Hyphomicrobiaceae bacterium]